MTKEQEVKEILNKFKNNETQRDKLEISRDGGWKIGDIYKHLELNPAIEIVLSMIEKKDKRLNRQFKLLMKKDREIEQKNKQIELISEKLAKAYHYKMNKCPLKEKEQNNIYCDKYKDCTSCVKQYYENQSKLFKYDYNKKSTLDINSNAKI